MKKTRPSDSAITGQSIINSLFNRDNEKYNKQKSEMMDDINIRQRVYQELKEMGADQVSINKPLNWQDYYVDGTEKFVLLFPLSQAVQIIFKSMGMTFNQLDRKTQYSMMFAEWSGCEMEGNIAVNQNRNQDAEKMFHECLDRAEQLDVNILRGRSIVGLLAIAEKLGDRVAQRKYIEQAKKYYEGTGDMYALKLEEKLALLDTDEGRLIPAERSLNAVLQKVSSPKNTQEATLFVDCLVDLATIKRFQNDWNAALQILDQCEMETAGMPDMWRKQYLVTVNFIRAKIFSTRFAQPYDLDKAQHAVDEVKLIGFHDWRLDELESDLAFKRQEWKKAAQLSMNVITQLQKEGWDQAVAAKRLQAANSLTELGDLKAAEKEIEVAMKHFKKNGPPDLFALALRSRSVLENKKGNAEEAWKQIQLSLDTVESLIRYQNSLKAQQMFLLDKLEYYSIAFNIALSTQGELGTFRAWQIAERSKSFYICQLLASGSIPLFEGIKPEDLEKMKDLEMKLDEIEIKIGLNKSNKDLAEPLIKNQSKLYSEKQKMLEQIMQENPRWALIKKPSHIDFKKEWKQLKGEWGFMSFYWQTNGSGKKLFIFYIDQKGNIKSHMELWSPEEYLKFIKRRNMLLKPGIIGAFDSLMPLDISRKILPSKVFEDLSPGIKLLISPHEALRGLPVHMFTVGETSKLIDLFPVQYIPTFSLLGLKKENLRVNQQALFIGCSKNGFGDIELKEVPEELNSLASIWKTKYTEVEEVLIDENETPADKGYPIKQWGKYQMLHIACHGTFPEDSPMDAALRLGKDAIRGSELFGCKLNADVVALSACELGKQNLRSDVSSADSTGDEWIGIYLPLFYAGAQNLLVSLWTANSALTPPFMKAFNESLVTGEKPAEAFSKACRSMKGKANSFWGNWYLVGFPS